MKKNTILSCTSRRQAAEQVADQFLAAEAQRARRMAYAPYSSFPVGAAVLTREGGIFTGCNVENASYGLTVCAERNALARAVSEGHREILAIAIAADTPEPVSPCGACRQVLAEFNPRMKVIMLGRGGRRSVSTLDRLLPGAFTKRSLKHTK